MTTSNIASSYNQSGHFIVCFFQFDRRTPPPCDPSGAPALVEADGWPCAWRAHLFRAGRQARPLELIALLEREPQ